VSRREAVPSGKAIRFLADSFRYSFRRMHFDPARQIRTSKRGASAAADAPLLLYALIPRLNYVSIALTFTFTLLSR
jgi:hypothetical protein